MRRSALVALALLLAVALLVTLGYLFLRDSGAGQAVTASATPQPAAPSALTTQLAEGEGVDLQGAEDPEPGTVPEPEARSERRGAATEDYDPALTIRVAGRVVLPTGTPLDEQAEVLVLPSRSSRDRAALAPDVEGEVEPVVLASGETWDPDELLARVPLEATGTFEVALAPDVEEAWLVLHGRYLHARTPRKVERGPETTNVELQAELGAWVTGSLRLPPEASAEELDRQALRVDLQPDELRGVGPGGVAVGRPERRSTRLDAGLRFAWGGVPAAVSYDVRLRPEAFAALKSARFAPKPGEHVHLDLDLTRGGRLAGRVVDDQGRPLAETEVTVEVDPLMMGMGGFEVREGESGADGGFQLAAVAAGKLILRAQKDGYLDAREEVELAEGETHAGLELALDHGHAIAGTLRWPDGSPVAEVEVRARFDPANLGGMNAFNAMTGPRGEGETDAAGAFEITGLGKGPFVVSARAEREGESWRARADAVAPDTRDLALVLAEPEGVAGRVVDELGQPLTSFRVRARTRTSGLIRGLGADNVEESFEDEQGHFRLSGLYAGSWEIAARAEGFGRAEELPFEVPRAPAEAELVLTVPRAASVRGVVLDTGGRPVQNATVTQQLTLQGIASEASDDGERNKATSDGNGEFLLEGLTPGSLSLVASAEGWAASVPAPIELSPSELLEGVVLTLRQGGRIVGEVFDKQGELLAGVTVLAQLPTDITNQRFSTTDADGHFEFDDLVPGTWQVMTFPGAGSLETVDGDDFGSFFSEMKLQMAEVLEGEETHVQIGAPPADPVRVTGVVRQGGEPQAGLMVSFIPDGAEGMQMFKMATTSADGTYAVDLDQPGGYLVQVQKLTGAAGQQQNVQRRADIPEESECEFDVDLDVGAITGLVTGPDGRPAAGVRVGLSVDGPISNRTLFGGHYAEIQTDAEGRYELVWLGEGTYTVAAGGPTLGGLFGGGDEDTPGREVIHGVRVREGQRVDGVDFHLKAPGRLSGNVRDGAGRPASGAAVFLRDDQGQLLERFSLVASDGAGRFDYGGLAPGRYTVTARDATRVTAADAQVTVREGQATKVDLTLSGGTILIVELSDREGDPVDCAVDVRDAAGRQVNGSWSLSELMSLSTSGAFSSKEQRVGPLPAGSYRVEATAEDGKSATKPVTLSGQDERTLKLRLRD